MGTITKRRALQVVRICGPFGVAALCLAVLLGNLETGALESVPSQLSQLSVSQVLLAGIATLVSFWAVGRYDVVTHRALGTGISPRRAQIAGTSAIALSQTLGFGVFTAAVARWRLLPDLSLPAALRVSAFVSLSFILALAVICALVSLVLPMPGWAALPATLILMATLILLMVLLFLPDINIAGVNLRLPSLAACGAIFGWTLVDTCAAGVALYVLMPASDLTIGLVLPAYLLALGAGLISGAPGGVGPFELALLAMLPQGGEAEVLAGVLAFRMIYYAVPAAVAGVALIRPMAAPRQRLPAQTPVKHPHKRPAELGILRQNNGKVAVFAHSLCAVWPTPQTLCMMFDPLVGPPSAALADLKQAARSQNKSAMIYKCGARTALAARKLGWQTVHVADEAVLNPATFDLSVRACRDLRRKLRQGAQANLHISHASHLPIAAMAQIDAGWQSAKGQARGGSMGRFCPEYLAQQRVYLAHHNGRLVGYLSLHIAADEWCLDLMRHAPDAPRGTMQMLVQQALEHAREHGISRFSLASVPAHPQSAGPLATRIIALARPLSKAAGLRRFKSSFAPRWERRYAAAPGRGSLALGLFDITRSIHRPLPLNKTNKPHKEDEECEVAL